MGRCLSSGSGVSVLTYTMNLVGPGFDHKCFAHAWYLSILVQYYLLTPPLLWLLGGSSNVNKFRPGHMIKFTAGIAALIAASSWATIRGVTQLGLIERPDPYDSELNSTYMTEVYCGLAAHATPYLFGLLAGAMAHTKTPNPTGWPRVLNDILCVATFALLLEMLNVSQRLLFPQMLWPRALRITWFALTRILLGAGVTVMLLCGGASGERGGLVGRFCHLRVWAFFSRLIYTMNLLHMIPVAGAYILMSRVISVRVSPLWYCGYVVFNLPITVAFSLVVQKYVEAPATTAAVRLVSRALDSFLGPNDCVYQARRRNTPKGH
eukprot:TRINITY_DN4653_c0_g1_i3.p1 TRINITY_DN4653_c0_g1~~TRINITY_DN4653_c0_g1_i3.p1  ORF type:complete len:322 (+),score=45.39 TRINITY_DN4653_c0_g1_i3:136-1101(+)